MSTNDLNRFVDFKEEYAIFCYVPEFKIRFLVSVVKDEEHAKMCCALKGIKYTYEVYRASEIATREFLVYKQTIEEIDNG